MKQQLNKLQKRTESPSDPEKTKQITTEQKDSDEKDAALDGLARYELSTKARALMGKHKTFASFSKDVGPFRSEFGPDIGSGTRQEPDIPRTVRVSRAIA